MMLPAKPIRITLVVIGILTTIASCDVATILDTRLQGVKWSDGDSGMIGSTKFRLSGVDAPETSPVGRSNGAKCQREVSLGREAKRFMVETTRGKSVTISADYGADRYGRRVVNLAVGGQDLGLLAINSGHLAPWPHEGQRSLSPKPGWC